MAKSDNPRNFAPAETALVLIIIALVAFTGWFAWHSKQSTDKTLNAASNSSQGTAAATVKAPTTFAECKAAKGSIMQETYPEVCVTKAGKRFTDTSQVSTGSQSDQVAIIAALKIYVQANFDANQTITTDSNTDFGVRDVSVNVARGTLRPVSGDVQEYVAQKQNGIWQIVYFGHQPPSDTVAAKYELPSSWKTTW